MIALFLGVVAVQLFALSLTFAIEGLDARPRTPVATAPRASVAPASAGYVSQTRIMVLR